MNLTSYLDSLRADGLAERTILGYENDLGLVFRWLGRRAPSRKLMQQYRDSLIADKLKPNTINRRTAAIKRWSRWAFAAGEIHEDVSAGLRPCRTDPPSPRGFNGEVEKLVGAAKTPLDNALLAVLLDAGLRLGETVALCLCDVDLGHRAAITVRNGKGRKYRTVPITQDTAAVLNAWLAVRPSTVLDAFFVKPCGRRPSGRTIARWVDRIAQRAGVEGVTPHRFRHQFCKALVDRGVPITVVAKLAGHASIKTTAIYCAPDEDDLRAAIEGGG